MSQFTIVGLYEDTGLTYHSHRIAESAEEAAQQVLEHYPYDQLSIVAVFDGHINPAFCPEYVERRDAE